MASHHAEPADKPAREEPGQENPGQENPGRDHRVACGGGAMGHPKIYLTVRAGETVRCPYCGHRFDGDSAG